MLRRTAAPLPVLVVAVAVPVKPRAAPTSGGLLLVACGGGTIPSPSYTATVMVRLSCSVTAGVEA
jgi:hypothetical protein